MRDKDGKKVRLVPKVTDPRSLEERIEALEAEMNTLEGTLGSLAKKVKDLEAKKGK